MTNMESRKELETVYEHVLAKSKEINEVVDKSFKTSGVINIRDSKIDITTESNLEVLIDVYAGISRAMSDYDNAANSLSITKYPKFKVDGIDAESLLEDIQLRTQIVLIDSEREQIEQAKRELEELFTEEERTKRAVNKWKDKFNLDIDTLALEQSNAGDFQPTTVVENMNKGGKEDNNA